MLRFLLRRFLTMLGILLVISFVLYGLLSLAMDPLDNLRQSTSPNKEQMIAARIRQLHLDESWVTRYFSWLKHILTGDLGTAWQSGQPVAKLLPSAISTSVQLVAVATIISALIGVTIGVVSALRQYSAFDYVITFVSFVLYALPVFWVAVLLKQSGINLNEYLRHPSPNYLLLGIVAVVAGLFWAGMIGGSLKRRAIIFASALVVTFGALAYVLATNWIANPQITIVGVLVVGLAALLASWVILAGRKNRRALIAGAVTLVIGLALYFPLQFFFVGSRQMLNHWIILALMLVTVLVSVAVGWFLGGDDRGAAIGVTITTGLVTALMIYLDHLFSWFHEYLGDGQIRGRVISTIGAQTPSYNPQNYWLSTLDMFTHALLPSMALVLIGFASYVRYERGATLEVLSQDYIRTARAKGLPERTVVVRHALRNALMPLASVIPVDVISMIGGAVLTETIFGWSGMGLLFITSLRQSEIDVVMAYLMITGLLAMIANLVADLLYGLLDPRIRIDG